MKKSEIRRILADMRISISKEVENELLDLYSGQKSPYTEQDIYEQLRKSLRPLKKSQIHRYQFLVES